jgi:hypothetical protein
MNVYFLLSAATLALFFSGFIWYAFLRPVPELSGIGMIVNKTFQPARTIQRYEVGPRRESWGQDKIVIPEGYLFDLRVEGLPSALQYSLPALAAERYSLGQKVWIRYVDRGIPMIRKRIQVTQMVAADPGSVP